MPVEGSTCIVTHACAATTYTARMSYMTQWNKVFLGGTCAGPDYRSELIPLLTCHYFNPVVKDWTPEAQVAEKQEKNDCGISLFVITPFAQGSFSIAEMSEDTISRRIDRTIVCFLNEYKGTSATPGVIRSNAAIVDMLRQHGCHVVEDLQQVAGIVNSMAGYGEPKDVYLCRNKWVSLKRMIGPTGEYTYTHEDRCGGRIVSVLPFRHTSNGTLILAREEFTPPWGVEKLHLSSITGGVDSASEDPSLAAARELSEEAGYTVPSSALISVGTVRGAKSSDTMYHLYLADVSSMPLVDQEAERGEDENEKRARNVWIPSNVMDAADPMLLVLARKLDGYMQQHPVVAPEGGFQW